MTIAPKNRHAVGPNSLRGRRDLQGQNSDL
jgi:hypothetical protein